MSARPSSDTQTRTYEIAIVGNDMLLAALPGRAVQLAHAILAAGYDLVVPVSWGEELIAEHALRELEHAPSHAMVFCACPLVRQRLVAAGNEIVPNMLSVVAPPVAAARYLRALQPDVPMRITYLGACPGAQDQSIDAQLNPLDALAQLGERNIEVTEQPMVFESTVPPDRRRHWSVPGGAPASDAMVARGLAARFVTVGADVAMDIAEAIMSSDAVLLDVAQAQGCACAGAIEVHQVDGSREAVIALEPPRSLLPVIDVEPRVGIALPLPHLSGPSGPRAVRSITPTHSAPASVTPIHEAGRARSERRRLAVTPSHVGRTEGRRPATTTPSASGSAAARRLESSPQRAVTPAPRSEPQNDAPLPAPNALPPEPAMVVPVSDLVVDAAPSVQTPRADPPAAAIDEPVAAALLESTRVPEGAPAEAERPPSGDTPLAEPAVTVRRRTPTYEMRHVARARSASAEPPRVPRAYSAVRSRARGVDIDAPIAEHTPHVDAVAPAHEPTPAPPLEVAAPIPVVVDMPAEPATPRAFAHRLERSEDASPARGRAWLIALAVATAGAMYYLLRG